MKLVHNTAVTIVTVAKRLRLVYTNGKSEIYFMVQLSAYVSKLVN
jgi:hypothetical protein